MKDIEYPIGSIHMHEGNFIKCIEDWSDECDKCYYDDKWDECSNCTPVINRHIPGAYQGRDDNKNVIFQKVESVIEHIFYPITNEELKKTELGFEMDILQVKFTETEAAIFEQMPRDEQIEFILFNMPEENKVLTDKELLKRYTIIGMKIQSGVCHICGCTHYDPCNHPEYGPCCWENEEQNLCSHCANPEIADDPSTSGPQNVISAVFPNNNLINSEENERESTNANY